MTTDQITEIEIMDIIIIIIQITITDPIITDSLITTDKIIIPDETIKVLIGQIQTERMADIQIIIAIILR